MKCDFPSVRSPEHARVLAGLTSVADWIGSSSLFDNPITDWQPLIKQSLDNAGFIRPEIKANLSFFDIFNFQPRDSQEKLFTQATQAGVYILEAPMGLGKTEAALYAAYKAISHGQATGIYFALPTQLTSDKIHDRVNQFLDKILTDDSSHKKALLLHGNAWLKETELETKNAKADFGVLVVKPNGVGVTNTANWWAIMSLEQVTNLLREAGYGTRR